MQKANTERCQGKDDKGKESDVPSSPDSCQENSCERLENEAANSPAQNASAENGSQEIYPWMKEFRSKGTKRSKVVISVFCPKNEREQGKWAEVRNNPFVVQLISVVIFLKSKTKSCEY